jgi:hypothetical protein
MQRLQQNRDGDMLSHSAWRIAQLQGLLRVIEDTSELAHPSPPFPSLPPAMLVFRDASFLCFRVMAAVHTPRGIVIVY